MVFNQLNVHQTDPSGFFKIKTTEISKAENSSFQHQISSCHFFIKKKHYTSVFCMYRYILCTFHVHFFLKWYR